MSDKQFDDARLAAFADLQLIGVPELAQLAQTGESWIRKGCQGGQLPFTRVGDQYRFTREQVAEIWRVKAEGPVNRVSSAEVATKRARAGRGA